MGLIYPAELIITQLVISALAIILREL